MKKGSKKGACAPFHLLKLLFAVDAYAVYLVGQESGEQAPFARHHLYLCGAAPWAFYLVFIAAVFLIVFYNSARGLFQLRFIFDSFLAFFRVELRVVVHIFFADIFVYLFTVKRRAPQGLPFQLIIGLPRVYYL